MSVNDYIFNTDSINTYGSTSGYTTITGASNVLNQQYPTPVWPARDMGIKNKEEAIAIINARIATLAQKAAKLARLREFFETMTSKQNDVVKDFWETIKKELD